MVVLFVGSGVLHLVRPSIYEPIVPPFLPDPRGLVLLSGVAELACAAALVVRRTRRWGGWASAALLVAIFPANVTMAVDAWIDWRHDDAGTPYLIGTLVRLPLQLPLIWWAWRVTRIEPGRRVNPS